MAVHPCICCERLFRRKAVVNGALGTVVKVSRHVVIIHFDHMTEPYDLERVQELFHGHVRVQKAVPAHPLVCRDYPQVPGTLVAIIDLSDKVFSAGMAYVALIRARDSRWTVPSSTFPARCSVQVWRT